MMLSSTLLLGFGVSYAPTLYSYMKEKYFKGSKIKDEFNRVFYGLGIIDEKKKERATYQYMKGNKNYVKFVFKLTDNITSKIFEKNSEAIKEKLNVSNLQIGHEKGRMFLKVRYDERDILYFSFFDSPSTLIPLGLDEDDNLVCCDLDVDSHLLIAGATNCGKSTMIRAIIFFLIKSGVYDIMLIDLKQGMEFRKLKNLRGVVGYAEDIVSACGLIKIYYKLAIERIREIRDAGFDNYSEFNAVHPGVLKRMFLIIDEFAELVPRKKKQGEPDIVDDLISLARVCRAAGMHILLSTQRPSKEVCDGSLKNNFTALIGLRTNNGVNSKIIIDENGLEDLRMGECKALLKGRMKEFYTMLLKGEQLTDLIKEYTRTEDEYFLPYSGSEIMGIAPDQTLELTEDQVQNILDKFHVR